MVGAEFLRTVAPESNEINSREGEDPISEHFKIQTRDAYTKAQYNRVSSTIKKGMSIPMHNKIE